MKDKFEKIDNPSPQERVFASNDKDAIESPETRSSRVFMENKDIVGPDRVFGAIFDSLASGRNSLNEKQQTDTLDLIEDLISKIRDYHDSYVNLKKTASKERRMYFGEDVQKYQETVKNADRREKILHDAFVDSINILSRHMKKVGLDNSWRGDSKIYGGNPASNRLKAKLWMFEIFGESKTLINQDH
ncbi:MAG: hypothetical protein Q8Q06_02430 [bacterium]|nr:hypothetical protein [bacterium]